MTTQKEYRKMFRDLCDKKSKAHGNDSELIVSLRNLLRIAQTGEDTVAVAAIKILIEQTAGKPAVEVVADVRVRSTFEQTDYVQSMMGGEPTFSEDEDEEG